MPKLYGIVLGGTNPKIDPDLAAAVEEIPQASLSNPDSFYNNPRRHREALEDLGPLLNEWQEEHGAFTDVEMGAAQRSPYGDDHRPRS